jgi:tyrosyl-tRNA synthetase
MLQQGGVSADGDVVSDIDVDAAALDGRVVRAGKKRFARIRISG